MFIFKCNFSSYPNYYMFALDKGRVQIGTCFLHLEIAGQKYRRRGLYPSLGQYDRQTNKQTNERKPRWFFSFSFNSTFDVDVIFTRIKLFSFWSRRLHQARSNRSWLAVSGRQPALHQNRKFRSVSWNLPQQSIPVLSLTLTKGTTEVYQRRS